MRRMTSGTVQLAAVLIACVMVLDACGPKTPTAAAPSEAASSPPAAAATIPAPPAPGITEASWSPDVLEELVAPIALYPDQLVGQILAASVNSQEVLDGGNWLLQNQDLKGDALDAAAQKAGLGPAMRGLVQFPSVVDMMCQEIDWTRQLGAAFTSDQASVLAAVQRLRAQASKVGNLKSTPQQTIETKVENHQTVIEIKPANPQIIYVPQYNPQVVYTTPPPPAPSTGTVSTENAVLGGLIAFGLGVAVGSAISQPNYCYPHWGVGAVYVGPRPFYPPAYVYRPVYGPGYRPAYGYHPPPGYRNNYINGDVNININNNRNNYFTRFDGNQDLRRPENRPGANRPGDGNWKGQSSYAGARNNPAGNSRLTSSAAGPTSAARNPGGGLTGTASRPGGASSQQGAAAGAALNNRASGGTANNRTPGGSRATGTGANSNVTNKLGSSNRASAPAAAQTPAAGLAANRGPPVDRGYGAPGSNRAGQGATRDNAMRPGPSAAPAARDRAFSGAGAGNGGFERTASARGRASAGANTSAGAAQGNRAAARR